MSAHSALLLRAALDARGRAISYVCSGTPCPLCRRLALDQLDYILDDLALLEHLVLTEPAYRSAYFGKHQDNAHLVLDLARRA